MDMTGAHMADEPEDPDAAADRLEAALDRIARLTALQVASTNAAQEALAKVQQTVPASTASPAAAEANLSIPEIAERLDVLIGRLRTALGKTD